MQLDNPQVGIYINRKSNMKGKIMIKKLSILFAVFAALFAIASPVAKVPANAILSVYANTSEIIKFPMVQAMLMSQQLPEGLAISDFDGKIAVGMATASKTDPKKNFVISIIFQTNKPTAAKLFAMFAESGMKSGAKKFKVGGKMAVGDKTMRAILVSPKEITIQIIAGKGKFTNLKKTKNLLASCPEVKNNSIVFAVQAAAFLKMGAAANGLSEIPAEVQKQIEAFKHGVVALKLKADGGLSIFSRSVSADPATSAKLVAEYNAKLEQLKTQQPALAAVLAKFTATAKGNTVIAKADFTAEEIQTVIMQVMMMVNTLKAAQPAGGIPTAPAAPATK